MRRVFLHRFERTWTEQRRFTLKTLKEFGFGKSGMEEMIREELNEFVPFLLEESKSGSISVMNLFNISILNIIWRIVNGSRYEYKSVHSDFKIKSIFFGLCAKQINEIF